ncbi:Tubulin polyglutamylase TTLL4 [Lamellibrachia satsuma]|nr:Tubulin polyglutamylase TTLL4 [Lamellibrachia satsuma]
MLHLVRYLSRPYLINGSKFDLRLYVYITSYDPLRIYLYDDGLVRFASCKYSYSTKTLSNRYMHLTNYSINKRNDGYRQNDDENVCQGHKWALKALWGYLKKYGVNTAAIWENIKDVVMKTVISSETFINSLVKSNVHRRYSCHELFGFDVFLDEALKPWIIEVNISPSLHSNSPLDMNIKGGMVKDMLNIAGFQIPDRSEVVSVPGTPPTPSKYTLPKGICMDKRLWPTGTSLDERTKHSYYVQRHSDETIQSTILDIITPDDLRILVESIDEDSRRGNFQRMFPSLTSQKYLQYFDAQRYYNLLLQAWVLRYNRLEAKGIMLLEALCQKRLHLMNPTTDTRHHWVPTRSLMSRVVSAPAIALAKSAEVCQPLPKLRRRRDSSVSMSHHLISSISAPSFRIEDTRVVTTKKSSPRRRRSGGTGTKHTTKNRKRTSRRKGSVATISTSLLSDEIPEVDNEHDGESEAESEKNKNIPIKSHSTGSLTLQESSLCQTSTMPQCHSAVLMESLPCTTGADDDGGH